MQDGDRQRIAVRTPNGAPMRAFVAGAPVVAVKVAP
jgi:hypothetical protein